MIRANPSGLSIAASHGVKSAATMTTTITIMIAMKTMKIEQRNSSADSLL
jgi:hypothetical protein